MIILIVAGIVIGVLGYKLYTDYRLWKLRAAARKEQEIERLVAERMDEKLAAKAQDQDTVEGQQ